MTSSIDDGTINQNHSVCGNENVGATMDAATPLSIATIPTGTGLKRPRQVLEDYCRCSQSIMWRMMTQFYEKQGISAWSKGIVPSFITCNSAIGRSYARVIAGFISDLSRNTSGVMRLDPNEKMYLVELGSGTGKLGFYILKALEQIRDRLDFPLDKIVYVLTDFTESNVSFWENHSDLKPFVDAGRLDFAQFEATSDECLQLRVSGEILRKNQISNPICIINNYLIDTLCHDIFQIEDGILKEGLVSVGVEVGARGDGNAMVIDSISNEYKYGEVGTDYYDNFVPPSERPHMSQILSWYQQYFKSVPENHEEEFSLKNGASFTLPNGFFIALTNLTSLSNGRALIIAGDKGTSNPQRMRGLSDPHLAFHGSFSFMCNFHAVMMFIFAKGGFAIPNEQEETSLQVNAYVLSGNGDSCTGTSDVKTTTMRSLSIQELDKVNYERSLMFRNLRNSFDDHIKHFSPNDFYLMQRSLKEEAQPSLSSIVALLKLSNWDPDVFFKFRETIIQALPRANVSMRQDLFRAATLIWDNHFHLNNDRDCAFELGRVFFGLQFYNDALRMYSISNTLYGDHYITHHNAGLCYSSLKRYDDAKSSFSKSLSLRPEYEKAKIWLETVTAEANSGAISGVNGEN